MPSFMLPILNFCVSIVGGAFATIFVVAALLLSLHALLEIADSYRSLFLKFTRILGIIEVVSGIFLPFRDISFIGTLICIAWCIILFDSVPYYQVFQLAGIALITIIFWATRETDSDYIFFGVIGDWTIFVLLPIVSQTVKLSRSVDLVINKTGNKLSDIRIPLDLWLRKLHNFIRRIM